MKTSTKALIAGMLAIGGLALAWSASAHGEKRYRGPGYAGHFGMAQHGMRLFDRFDTDKDGGVTQEEVDKSRAGALSRHDADGDGTLSLKEFEALWLEMVRERMVDRFQHLDRDGDAVVTAEEFAMPTDGIVARMDQDDDGRVTKKEIMQSHRGPGHQGAWMRHRFQHRN